MEVPKPKQLKVRGGKLERGLRIRGSCNGLVLLSSNSVDLFLWNPSTRCCKKVFSHARLETFEYDASGLFYDSSTDDYKVVMAWTDWSRELDDDKVMVGSFKNKTWTQVCLPYDKLLVQSEPTVNERVHWLVTKRTCNTGFGDTNFLVMGFDPHANEFVQVPMPQAMPQSKKEKPILGLGVLDGCLALAFCTDCIRLHEIEVEVFVMKKYGDQGSWTSLFFIPNIGMGLSHCRIWVPLCFAKNAEVLVQPETPLVRRIFVHSREFNFFSQILIEPKNCL